MYNLLVSGRGWAQSRDDILADRMFEYTESRLIDRFRARGQIDFAALCELPALLLDETQGDGENQTVRVGRLTRARLGVKDIRLEYAIDPQAPPLKNAIVRRLARELDIEDFEFARTHWAVKDVDLYRVLLHAVQPRRPRPRVFSIADPENIEPSLVSAMMPFHPHFDAVFEALKATASAANLRCRRADDIWENPAVMQDIVSLIDRSHIVIADCTGRNPNVFYETGIAHALGRDVILITQNDSDIPFDLRHLRYVRYLNNDQGLRDLAARLLPRLVDLAAA